MKLTLPSGATYFTNDKGERVCTGSQMGRRNVLPSDFPDRDYPDGNQSALRLQLQRLPFVDQCYDRWGAYWGSPGNIWCAFIDGIRVFVRADTRADAKGKVRLQLPAAKFYR